MERTLFLSFVGLCIVATSHAAAPKYRLVALENAQTTGFFAGMGISADNEAVFLSLHQTTFAAESFSWKNGVKVSLVGVGGAGVNGFNRITAEGTYYNSSGYYDGSLFVRFPDRSEEGFTSRRVNAFNDNLYGVGSVEFEGAKQTYLYENGIVRIGTLGGFRSEGLDIDKNNNAIVGEDDGGAGKLWYGQGTTWRNLAASAPALGNAYYFGAAMNDRGMITTRRGVYTINASGGVDTRTMLLSASGKVPEGVDINNHGWVLANAANADGVGLINDGTTTWDLHQLIENLPAGVDGFRGEQINDNGWIVGTYKIGSDRYAAVLQPVPEPMSLLALGAGVAALMRRRRVR